MGKKLNKKDTGNLGKSLVRDKFGSRKKSSRSLLHTSEIQDGQDWNRINFRSITEQTDVDSFLATAELAGTEFKAEKLNIKFIHPSSFFGVLSEDEKRKIKNAQEINKNMLRIPRRPHWDRSMNAEQLAEFERDSFLTWRRSLNQLQEKEGITLTPFEKNLEFWRQLWRVIERSDVVIQIVDARNPLLFYCEDLKNYVTEVDRWKKNILLVNKADFLTEEQRKEWASYFKSMGIQALFYSALIESEISVQEDNEEVKEGSECNQSVLSETESIASNDLETAIEECQKDLKHLLVSSCGNSCQNSESIHTSSSDAESFYENINSYKLLNRCELIEFFQKCYDQSKCNNSHVVIGLVGYPNVGKSSTINSLMQEKKVSVSATPGKTKHFQTLFLTKQIMICDCPGLVFPAFVSSKEEMIISGILPIDQMRDHVPPTNLVLSLIPRNILEDTYGVKIPLPIEGEDMDRHPVSEEFLNVYGYMRGFMTPRGIPDHPRSARYILKDFINGKLLYCHSPPNVSQNEYHSFKVEKVRKQNLQITPHQKSAVVENRDAELIDANFFKEIISKSHIKGQSKCSRKVEEQLDDTKKPWRIKPERKRKEKSRIKFAHLDK